MNCNADQLHRGIRKDSAVKQLRKPGIEIRRILADNIRGYRRLNHLSQEGLADICGLHRTYVGSVERGERNVTLSTLEAFATALRVPVPDLLSRKGLNK